jgi:hypothetical protein
MATWETARRTLYLPYRPANGPKFRIKRDAETVARFLTEHGYEVEWIKRNWGGQGQTTWNVRLTDGQEIHSRNQLIDMGFTVRYGRTDAASRKKFDGPPDYGVSIAFTRGRWTVNIGWTERGKRESIGCGHAHMSHSAAWRCAAAWRRRIAGDSE